MIKKLRLKRKWAKRFQVSFFDRKPWFLSISARKAGFRRFWPGNWFLVDFAQKANFWSILAKKKLFLDLVLVDFGPKYAFTYALLAGKVGSGRFWPKKLSLVDFGQTNWFWAILAENTGFGWFRPERLVVVRFGQKSSFWSTLAENPDVGRFWPERLVLVDFGQKSLVWPILTGKTSFG